MKSIINACKSLKDAKTIKTCIVATACSQSKSLGVYGQLGNFEVKCFFSSDADTPNRAVGLLPEAALTVGRCELFECSPTL